jgi:hypothetical protein
MKTYSYLRMKDIFTILEFGSVVYWSQLLATDPQVSGSIPGATRFSEKTYSYLRMKEYFHHSWVRLCGLVVTVTGYRSRGLGSDSRCYQIFWQVVGLERGPLSLLSTIEELLGRNSSGSGLETREYGRGDPLRWPRDTLYLQKLALTLPTNGGRSVGKTKPRSFLFCVLSSALDGNDIK